MKKRLLALLTCAFALCIALVGCGGAKVDNSAFIGTWELNEMETEGEVTSSDDLELLKDFLGMAVYLDLNDDGTLALDVWGETLDGTWEATSASEANATADDQSLSLAIGEDGRLTMSQDGASMIFVQIDPAEKIDNAAAMAALSDLGLDDIDDLEDVIDDVEEAEETGSASTQQEATALDILVADDDVATIKIISMEEDWAGDPSFTIQVTNKTDRAIYVTSSYGTWSVNNKMDDPIFGITVQPGKYAESDLWFSSSDLGIALADFEQMEGAFEIWDDETYEDIASYDFSYQF